MSQPRADPWTVGGEGIGADTFCVWCWRGLHCAGKRNPSGWHPWCWIRGVRRNDFKLWCGTSSLPYTQRPYWVFCDIPEGLTWCPRGIYNHSQRISQELLLKILIQPKKFFTGLVTKPLNQCHTLGVILLASVELVNSVWHTGFNQRPPYVLGGVLLLSKGSSQTMRTTCCLMSSQGISQQNCCLCLQIKSARHRRVSALLSIWPLMGIMSVLIANNFCSVSRVYILLGPRVILF